MIYLGSLLIIAIAFILTSFLKVGLNVTWLRASLVFIGLLIIIMLVDWIKAAELALFLSIFLALPIASKIYETLVAYIGIKIPKSAKAKGDKALASEMKYKRIILAIVCFFAFFVFKYTTQLPLALEYLAINDFFTDGSLLDAIVIYFAKTLDKLIAFSLAFYGLLTSETIQNYVFTRSETYRIKKGDKLVFLVPLLIVFLAPLGFNAGINSYFQLAVEEKLQKEGIKKGAYELSFERPYDLRTKDKRIEVNYWTDGTKEGKPHQKTYIYKDKQVKILKKKEVSNENA